MWTYAEDVQNDEIMNPLGTVVSNPNVDHATSLTVAFTSYLDNMSIVYPDIDAIEEVASQNKKETPAVEDLLPAFGNQITSKVK